MTEHRTHATHETLAQRKERLLLQCHAYRAAVGHSRQVLRNKLTVQAIATTAVGLAGLRAQSTFAGVADLFDLKHMSVDKLKKLLPLLASGYSLLSGRALLKPILRGAVIVGTAGAAMYFLSRKKTKKAHEHVALHEYL
jgi:alpha-D-ribose 1-methylphosphonate 5-triphosphate synthase subunit PhnG